MSFVFVALVAQACSRTVVPADAANGDDALSAVDGQTDSSALEAASDVGDRDTLVCAQGPTTFDCGSEAIAESICARAQPCHVCVQTLDASGTPVTWMAVQESPSCPCPPAMSR